MMQSSTAGFLTVEAEVANLELTNDTATPGTDHPTMVR